MGALNIRGYYVDDESTNMRIITFHKRLRIRVSKQLLAQTAEGGNIGWVIRDQIARQDEASVIKAEDEIVLEPERRRGRRWGEQPMERLPGWSAHVMLHHPDGRPKTHDEILNEVASRTLDVVGTTNPKASVENVHPTPE